MKISVVHNPTAGGGREADDIVALLADAGHDVRHRSSKGNWMKLLQDPGDLLVAAGGDGTVRKVVLAAADHGLRFAVLPIGTANNIAKTLGMLGDARELVERWSTEARPRPFDVGSVSAAWGSERFGESIGGGPVAELIGRAEQIDADATLLGRETDRALHVFGDLVRDASPGRWRIEADGDDFSGDYLAVEVLNTRFVGPNVPLAPGADPSDGLLDVVLLRSADRDALLRYIDDRLHLASGRLPALRSVRARRVELLPPPAQRMHVDDRLWPSDGPPAGFTRLEVRCLPGAASLLGGG